MLKRVLRTLFDSAAQRDSHWCNRATTATSVVPGSTLLNSSQKSLTDGGLRGDTGTGTVTGTPSKAAAAAAVAAGGTGAAGEDGGDGDDRGGSIRLISAEAEAEDGSVSAATIVLLGGSC